MADATTSRAASIWRHCRLFTRWCRSTRTPRRVKLRAQDGTITGDVYVGEGIYNLSKLNPGDKVQVNFLEPDGLSKRLAAANIWKVQ